MDRHILLETYRRDGRAVRTPVWFVPRGGDMYVITRDMTGKAKRLRHSKRARFAPCSFRGTQRGEWTRCTATLEPGMTGQVMSWRNQRYGMLSRLAAVASRGRGEIIAVRLVPES
ncbi:MAG: hypothetical protein MPI95_06070 [Nitrosopumilus sp.]|nr:hypothetical protein [Nitrosopumilus sp.]MDA7943357.1 hypothetical protein [Nitrosopumilus sp.]MDA7952949.1 hypothetical protein [Nitrosopumilus sp.]MDA7958636.1 hypothetical protein [Nitrosopumilus sp.]MDA7960081.1 hypothetical protein [Nitrosopumilus sp.]